MEDKKTEERVLAYSLATEINLDDLTQIAGGSGALATWVVTGRDTGGGRDAVDDHQD